jgi:hypothetical protein
MSKRKSEPVENRQLAELGEKFRAGRVLSEYIRGIAAEKTELITDPDTGKTKIVSKGEALARQIWLKALGYEFDHEQDKYVSTGMPSLAWIKLIMDRVEGKSGVQSEDLNDGRPSVVDRVSDMNKERLNAMASGGEE